ncbi:MAG: hypothetical protein QXS74_06375 [Nitrososphaeria archaeon]
MKKKKRRESERDGICINFFWWVKRNDSDCPVGAVRKLREKIEYDDNTCNTCPYFFDFDKLYKIKHIIDKMGEEYDSLS